MISRYIKFYFEHFSLQFLQNKTFFAVIIFYEFFVLNISIRVNKKLRLKTETKAVHSSSKYQLYKTDLFEFNFTEAQKPLQF